MASVPSKIAFATSEASALVGRGLRCMESSICVAVITGLPTLLHSRINAFCTSGTSSGGISTPKSPRATMDPSDTSRMRSEEHTSELQSRGHLVCRLLLEKKKEGVGYRDDIH